MKLAESLPAIQEQLRKDRVDGWLLYDFRRSNALACRALGIGSSVLLTRRFFYWIPFQGVPVKIVSAIEPHVLASLPGTEKQYRSWEELQNLVQSALGSSKKVAMEYSPQNAIPYVSKVDGGTLEMIRSWGIEVASSADLLQTLTSVWSSHQLQTHLKAADILNWTVEHAWKKVAEAVGKGKTLTEYDVQQEILEQLHKRGCVMEGEPICAVNEHSADPHFSPTKGNAKNIQKGDFLLIDLWAKLEEEEAVYADFTQVASVGVSPSRKLQEIFLVVREAQKKAIEFLKSRQEIQGWEVDRVCRKVIEQAGYGTYFIHRTGHSIDVSDHGAGANLDDFETHDTRFLLPGTGFSIEPGIYLPGEFGVRLEVNAFIPKEGRLQITGKLQEALPIL